MMPASAARPAGLAEARDQGSRERAVLRLHGGHPWEGGGQRKQPRVAGENAGDHCVDQHFGGVPTNAAAGEVEDRFVSRRPARCEWLTQDSQAAGERQDVRPQKGQR